MSEQCENYELVRQVAQIVREADKAFEASGGGTRHWVRDHFLPVLNAYGFEIARVQKTS
jgi:hypothetical protein